MRRWIGYIVMVISLSSWLQCATRGDVNVLEATESIRYVSQKMAREYIYFYLNPKSRYAQHNMETTLAKLTENIRTISSASNDEKTVKMLKSMAHTKEQILQLLKQNPTKDNITLMLDYCETLLRGADAIAQEHTYVFSNEEKMLIASKNMQYFLERTLKNYLFLYVDHRSKNNVKQLQQAVAGYDTARKSINAYEYPVFLSETLDRIDAVWDRSLPLILKGAHGQDFIPELITEAITHMENRIDKLVLYHSRKL